MLFLKYLSSLSFETINLVEVFSFWTGLICQPSFSSVSAYWSANSKNSALRCTIRIFAASQSHTSAPSTTGSFFSTQLPVNGWAPFLHTPLAQPDKIASPQATINADRIADISTSSFFPLTFANFFLFYL